MITIKLTPEEAQLVFNNADGWLDAGACEDGLEPDENAALEKLCHQIAVGLKRAKAKPAKGEGRS